MDNLKKLAGNYLQKYTEIIPDGIIEKPDLEILGYGKKVALVNIDNSVIFGYEGILKKWDFNKTCQQQLKV